MQRFKVRLFASFIMGFGISEFGLGRKALHFVFNKLINGQPDGYRSL